MKLAALAFALCACSRTVDTASHLDLRQDVEADLHLDAGVQEQEQGGSRETGAQAPTSILEIGAWDEPVEAPDAGVSDAGGPPRVIHHPPVKLTVIGGRTWELDAWQSASMAGEEHVDIAAKATTVVKADDSKKTDTEVGPPRWVWVFVPVVLLALGALAWKLKPAWLGWLWRLLGLAT